MSTIVHVRIFKILKTKAHLVKLKHIIQVTDHLKFKEAEVVVIWRHISATYLQRQRS